MASNKIKEKPYCISVFESRVLEQYFNEKDRLVFTEFNTTYGFEGKIRALDAIRYPELEKGILGARHRYEEIKSLLSNSEVELIEVHHWGFYRVMVNTKCLEKEVGFFTC